MSHWSVESHKADLLQQAGKRSEFRGLIDQLHTVRAVSLGKVQGLTLCTPYMSDKEIVERIVNVLKAEKEACAELRKMYDGDRRAA